MAQDVTGRKPGLLHRGNPFADIGNSAMTVRAAVGVRAGKPHLLHVPEYHEPGLCLSKNRQQDEGKVIIAGPSAAAR